MTSDVIRDDRVDVNLDFLLGEAAGRVGAFAEEKVLDLLDTQRPLLEGKWQPKAVSTMARKDYKGKWKLWIHTGELRSKITHRVDIEGGEYRALVGIFDHPKAQMAAWLEYGSGNESIVAGGQSHSYSRQPARPLFRLVFTGDGAEELDDFIVEDLKAQIIAKLGLTE